MKDYKRWSRKKNGVGGRGNFSNSPWDWNKARMWVMCTGATSRCGITLNKTHMNKYMWRNWHGQRTSCIIEEWTPFSVKKQHFTRCHLTFVHFCQSVPCSSMRTMVGSMPSTSFNISASLSHPLTSFNILQHPSTSFNTLQHPSSSFHICQHHSAPVPRACSGASAWAAGATAGSATSAAALLTAALPWNDLKSGHKYR